MSEVWRKKTYYQPRIIVETQRVLESSLKDSLICLTGAEIEMLRNMVHYLERRSTFASEYQQSFYLCPSNEEWDNLMPIVASLQEKLMGCDIDLLIDAINSQTDVIDALMSCVCASTTLQEKQMAELPDLSEYVELDRVTYKTPEENYGAFTPPATDEAKCELAQAFWYYIFQTYTEDLLPFADSAADVLVGATIATALFGALALFLGMPVLILGAIVFALVQWGVSGSIDNFINWMLGTKSEIICIIYDNLPDAAATATALSEYIDADGELSFLDKKVLQSIMASEWHITWVLLDQEQNGTWDSYLTPGQCDICTIVPPACFSIGPCDLDDWDNGTLECRFNLAMLTGGLNWWVKESHVPVSGDYLVVHWIPRSDGYPTAAAYWGLTRVSDSFHFSILPNTSFPVDVPVTLYASVPSQLWGVECYLDSQQDSWYVSPLWWCLQQTPP